MSKQTEEFPPDMVVNLDIGEGNLDRFLALTGDSRTPLIKYHNGELSLVSPSGPHERGVDHLDGIIKAICAELDIDYYATASTLYRRPGRDHGIEADKTYYIANAGAVGDIIGGIDLAVSPPPDLAVETVNTNSPAKSLVIYQELGVPEVWVYWVKTRVLEFLHLGGDGRYSLEPTSRSFPFLAPGDVLPWLETVRGEPDNRWEQRVREWVRTELAPRYRPGGGPGG